MKGLLNRLAGVVRKELKLIAIEQEVGQLRDQMQEVGQLRDQIAGQEVRMAVTQALVMDRQHLLLEKVNLLQQELERVTVLQEIHTSKKNNTTCCNSRDSNNGF